MRGTPALGCCGERDPLAPRLGGPVVPTCGADLTGSVTLPVDRHVVEAQAEVLRLLSAVTGGNQEAARRLEYIGVVVRAGAPNSREPGAAQAAAAHQQGMTVSWLAERREGEAPRPLALLAFGSGVVRGFAVVHCLGILTSMFSAVFFSRGLVNLWYGRQKKLQSVSIGTVWRA